MLDLAIRGGSVIDGTGRAAFLADVGITDGRIVSVGPNDEPARRVVDADTRVVAPGFIDVHTHYDAQVMWDATISSSSLHGVTSVIGGNCGFTIAPVTDESADYVMRMLACVEGMPLTALEAVLEFNWQSFGEWLDRLEGAIAVNAGFLVGHSTIRRMVMGDAWQDSATPSQLERMAEVVEQSIIGGAMGFSSSWGGAHGDHLGNPVPSRFADAHELVTLASVLRPYEKTMLEFIPPSVPIWPDDVVELMATMSREAASPLNWNLLSVGTGVDARANDARLAASDRAASEGGEIVALTLPTPTQWWLNLETSIVFNFLPEWQRVLTLDDVKRRRELQDVATRARLAKAVEDQIKIRQLPFLDFANMTIQTATAKELAPLQGRIVGEVARERGGSPLDAFLDIAVADDLRTCFRTPAAGDDEDSWRQRALYWQDSRVMVGGSDAGAHLDLIATFACYSDFIGPSVRDRHLLALEDAVHKITDVPARFYGLAGRGRIAPGFHADVVIFDPDSVSTEAVGLRHDVPGGQARLFAGAAGIDCVMVNGIEIVRDGSPTGATPGAVLRAVDR